MGSLLNLCVFGTLDWTLGAIMKKKVRKPRVCQSRYPQAHQKLWGLSADLWQRSAPMSAERHLMLGNEIVDICSRLNSLEGILEALQSSANLDAQVSERGISETSTLVFVPSLINLF